MEDHLFFWGQDQSPFLMGDEFQSIAPTPIGKSRSKMGKHGILFNLGVDLAMLSGRNFRFSGILSDQ